MLDYGGGKRCEGVRSRVADERADAGKGDMVLFAGCACGFWMAARHGAVVVGAARDILFTLQMDEGCGIGVDSTGSCALDGLSIPLISSLVAPFHHLV